MQRHVFAQPVRLMFLCVHSVTNFSRKKPNIIQKKAKKSSVTYAIKCVHASRVHVRYRVQLGHAHSAHCCTWMLMYGEWRAPIKRHPINTILPVVPTTVARATSAMQMYLDLHICDLHIPLACERGAARERAATALPRGWRCQAQSHRRCRWWTGEEGLALPTWRSKCSRAGAQRWFG